MQSKHILTVLGLVALLVFAWLAWDEIKEAFILIWTFDWRILILIVPLQLFNYLIRAWVYQSLLEYFGYFVRTWRLYDMTWAVNFVTLTMPSMGLSAASVVGMALRGYGVPAGTAAMVQFGKYGLMLASFSFVLLGTLLVMLSGGAEGVVVRFVLFIVAGIIGLTVFLVYVLYNERAFDWVMRHVQRFVDWISRKLRNGRDLIGTKRMQKLLLDFFDGFREIMEKRVYLKRPFLLALSGNVLDVALFYLFFLAVGYAVSPVIAVIAYALATSTGFVSIIPGDIGVYEVVMVAVLTAAGVPLSVGLSVTLTYRVLVKLLFLPVGFYFYNRLIGEV